MAFDPYKLLPRLAEFVDGFAGCFSRKKHAGHAQSYVRGLLSDARRKNMGCLLGQLTGDVDYQRLQHFITHSTWDWQRVWDRLLATCTDREGILAIDDTGIPKQGCHSVGVHRQYCGALGKVGNCQVVVSTVLRAPRAIWPLAMDLYLPEAWTSDEGRRDGAGVPTSHQFRTKWEIALEQVDRVLTAGIRPSCVTADAAYGECYEFRKGLAKRGLDLAVGVSGDFKVFAEPPIFVQRTGGGKGRRPSRMQLSDESQKPITVSELASRSLASEWRKVTWRTGTKGPLAAKFLITRVTPSRRWSKGEMHEECWLICERPIGTDAVRKFHISTLPADTTRKELIRITHERWAIEHNYRQLKDELGLDHFEGRSFPGFHRHLALTAVAYAFLETERRRSRAKEKPTLNAIRRSTTEMLTMLLFASGERSSQLILQFIRDPPIT